jgi:hypothetical protein
MDSATLERAKKAIAGIESSGNYAALGVANKAGQRAYGKYQVMDFNIPSWTKAALGKSFTPQQFLADPQAQEKVFEHKFQSYVQQYGSPENAAKVWFGGPGALNNPNAKDVLGTSVSGYAQKFNQSFGDQPQYNASSGSLPSMAELSQVPGAEGQQNGLLSFADSLSKAVNLAKQNRNSVSLDFMKPFAGTVAASDFNSVLGHLNQASDTFAQDQLKNNTPTYKTEQVGNTVYQFQVDGSGKIIGKPVPIVSSGVDDGDSKVLSVAEAQALGVPYGTTQTEASALGKTPEKPPTEAQGKDLTYANRADQANVFIKNLESEVTKANPIQFSAERLAEPTTIGNTFVSDTIRQVSQAERNFLTALLRRESGATISPSEFAVASKQYFPRPGDDQQTLKQKAQNRQTAIDSFRQSAGSAGAEPSAGSFTGKTSSGLGYTVIP